MEGDIRFVLVSNLDRIRCEKDKFAIRFFVVHIIFQLDDQFRFRQVQFIFHKS